MMTVYLAPAGLRSVRFHVYILDLLTSFGESWNLEGDASERSALIAGMTDSDEVWFFSGE